MVFGLFEPKCPICGMKLTGNAIEKFGKKFCSNPCAKQYEKGMRRLVKGSKKKSCCG